MTLRRFLLGSAAMLASGQAAQAADIPAPEAVDYVRICDVFGDGFYYIPGTQTCLQTSGVLRAEAHYVDGDTTLLFGGPAESDFNRFTTRARAVMALDARTNTDFGLIRSYLETQWTIGPGDYSGFELGPDYAATDTDLVAAFIEVANDAGTFTAGHTSSFFDFYSSHTYGTRIDIDDSTNEQTLFAYTFAAGNGLRGTLSIEDPASSGRRLDADDLYEGQDAPDLVGNVRYEGEALQAQVMGALRRIHDEDDDAIAWAVGAGLSATLPVLDLGFFVQAGYSEGAIAYVTGDPGGIGDYAFDVGIDPHQAWSIRSGVSKEIIPTVTAWVDGSYTHAQSAVPEDEYDFWAVVAGAQWQPVDTLAMGPELGYNHIEWDETQEEGDVWGAMWRVESSF